MNALVTGGAGFIGSHVAAKLFENGLNVLVIDDLSGGFIENIPDGVSFEKISINANLSNLFRKFKPDYVYHLAAYAAEGLSHHIPIFNYQNNLIGTINLLNESFKSNVKHFIFTSSIAVYGHSQDGGTFDETTTCSPVDPYGIAKYACENHINAFNDYFDKKLNYTIFRPHNVFGPKQNISDPYRNVVGIFFSSALKNLPMPIFGDGHQTRSFSYIDVVAECIAGAPFIEMARNKIFNLGGDEAMSVLELAKYICNLMGIKENIKYLPERKEVKHAHSNHELVRSVFEKPYQKQISIKEGLKRMYEYVKTHPIPHETGCPSNIEIANNLPPSWKNRLGTNG